MNVFDFIRPKHKHADPAVRAAAVATLTDQALLADIALTDQNVDVGTAALQRVTDEELRSTIARSSSPLNASALEGISQPAVLAEIAQHAESATVRARAAARIVDARILHKVAAHDLDPAVRLQARSRLGDADRLQPYLRTLLLRLEPSAAPPANAATGRGGLDEVCAAVMHDGRFQIDAVVAEPPPTVDQSAGGTGAGTQSSAAPGWVELLAHSRNDTPHRPEGQVIHYQIRICRRADNAFEWWMTECRSEMTHDVESWASSSRG